MNTTTLRHEPTDECHGHTGWHAFAKFTCEECGEQLCPCEATYGHDCEDNR